MAVVAAGRGAAGVRTAGLPAGAAQALADPNDTQPQAQANTLFKGETLRGLLVNAYAFWKVGQIALYAAIAAFVGAGLILALTILGYLHLRKVPSDAEVFARGSANQPAGSAT